MQIVLFKEEGDTIGFI
jgi:hypothetical protein